MQALCTESPCRAVTDKEIKHYREFGWVKLKQFICVDTINHLLQQAKARMGEDGDHSEGLAQPYFTVGFANGLQDPLTRPLIEHIGQAAAALMPRQISVRYFADFYAPKLPAAKKSSNAGNGPTAFHQDYITFGIDRSGGMTFWIPLEAYGPDAGTMAFINGSHQLGVMGSYHTYGDGDARDAFPELNDLQTSESMTYEPGDITVHSHLTIHGAGVNDTDKPRWSYIVLAQPADICWNGAPSEAFDTTGMQMNQPLDDNERFPIIG